MNAANDRAKLRNLKRHSAQQHRKMANARAARERKRLEAPPPPRPLAELGKKYAVLRCVSDGLWWTHRDAEDSLQPQQTRAPMTENQAEQALTVALAACLLPRLLNHAPWPVNAVVAHQMSNDALDVAETFVAVARCRYPEALPAIGDL